MISLVQFLNNNFDIKKIFFFFTEEEEVKDQKQKSFISCHMQLVNLKLMEMTNS